MNLLITGAWAQALDYIEQLSKKHDIIFLQWEKDELPCEYEWVEGIIGNSIFMTHPIEKFKKLHFIQLTSAGYDRVPMEYIRKHGIEIYNAKSVYSIPMAEFAVAGVLQLYKQNGFFLKNQERHCWEKKKNILELYQKKVCIVGCGNVGDECAKRFKAFGCEVVGINRSKKRNSSYDIIYELENLQKIMKDSDIIILTIALTEETRHLIGINELEAMKNTAVLVNLARGGIIDTKALIQKLPGIGGAILDVFEEEPLSEESVLWNMGNVVITPHNSFQGEGNQKRLAEVILRNII